MDDNGGYDIMFPGIYKGYKEGDPQIKADNGLSDANTKILRDVANQCREISINNLEDDAYYIAGRYRNYHQAIEEVIGHPKYYI